MSVSIWDFAKDKVDHKGFLEQTWNSRTFAPLKKATRSPGAFGSVAASGLVAVSSIGVKLLPIPYTSVIGKVIKLIDKKVKSKLHKNRSENAKSDDEQLKFDIKLIDVKKLDPYRSKVEESWKALQKGVEIYNSNAVNAKDQGSQCVPQVDLAMLIMQAERRLGKFEDEVTKLLVILKASEQWAAEIRGSVFHLHQSLDAQMTVESELEKKELMWAVTTADQERVANDIKSRHVNCCNSLFKTDYCIHGKNVKNSTWTALKNGATNATGAASNQFPAKSIISELINELKDDLKEG